MNITDWVFFWAAFKKMICTFDLKRKNNVLCAVYIYMRRTTNYSVMCSEVGLVCDFFRGIAENCYHQTPFFSSLYWEITITILLYQLFGTNQLKRIFDHFESLIYFYKWIIWHGRVAIPSEDISNSALTKSRRHRYSWLLERLDLHSFSICGNIFYAYTIQNIYINYRIF